MGSGNVQLSEADQAELLQWIRTLNIYIDDLRKAVAPHHTDAYPRTPEQDAKHHELHEALRESLADALRRRHEAAVALGIGGRYPPELQ